MIELNKSFTDLNDSCFDEIKNTNKRLECYLIEYELYEYLFNKELFRSSCAELYKQVTYKIGNIYSSLQNYDESLKYYNKSLEIIKERYTKETKGIMDNKELPENYLNTLIQLLEINLAIYKSNHTITDDLLFAFHELKKNQYKLELTALFELKLNENLKLQKDIQDLIESYQGIFPNTD